MKLPNSKNAYVPNEKLIDYLLSETHIDGRTKAKFFRSIGFNEGNISKLEMVLLKVATQPVKNISESIHGIKYIIEGEIQSPTGKVAKLRTVWILEPDKKVSRFITAYPV